MTMQLPRASSAPAWAQTVGKTVMLWLLLINFPVNFARADLTSVSQVSIQMGGPEIPATDLVGSDGRAFTPDDAAISKKPLWTFDPNPSATYWQGKKSTAVVGTAADTALAVKNGDVFTYQGGLDTPEHTYFRFLVQPATGGPKTLVVSHTLHTYLLRKELLRRLGYLVPPFKALQNVQVTFHTELERDEFLNSLSEDSDLPVSRVVLPYGTHDLTLSLQDVAATDWPERTNLALAPPQPSSAVIAPEKARIYRALAIFYGLVDSPESVNQFGWFVGRVDSGVYHYGLPDFYDFNCQLQDALWALHYLGALDRPALAAMVKGAGFPDAVGQLILEKIISRRDAMLASFSVAAPKILPAANPEITVTEGGVKVVDRGKLLQKSFPTFASHFAAEDIESPFKDLRPYALSEAMTLLLQGGVPALNEKIPQLSTNSAIRDHQNDLLQNAIDQLQKTGEVPTLKLKPWTAPLLDGAVQESRGIYPGSYMGTNNQVQIYDTFGVSLSAGVYIGVDALPSYVGLEGSAQGSVSFSITRIQPIMNTNLKAAVRRQYTDNLVPFITNQASRIYRQMAVTADGPAPANPADLDKKLAAEMDELRKVIGVGDSLILTESATASATATASVTAMTTLAPSLVGQIAGSKEYSRRIQLLRENENTVQVFEDGGDLSGLPLAFSATTGKIAQFPIVTGYTRGQSSSSHCAIYELNIDPHPETNPDFAKNAIALGQILRTGSTSILDENWKAAKKVPATIHAKSKDRSNYLQFLQFVFRSLKNNQQLHVEIPGQNFTADYIYALDGDQKGVNYEQLATQFGTYLIQRLTHNSVPGIDTQGASDPGQSKGGHSETREGEYQAKVEPGLPNSVLRINHRWAGTNISADKVYALVAKQDAYFKLPYPLYAPNFLNTATDLTFYQIITTIELYAPALRTLMSIDNQSLGELKNRYWDAHHCNQYFSSGSREGLSGDDESFCDHFENFREGLARYRKKIAKQPTAIEDLRKVSADMISAVMNLYEAVPFHELERLAGGNQHLYVHGSVSGFRKGTEEASDEIDSATYGYLDAAYPVHALDAVQQLLNTGQGEMLHQWLDGALLY